MYLDYCSTKIGCLGITATENAITHILFPGNPEPRGIIRKRTPLIREAAEKLKEYFEGQRKIFDFPIFFSGTPFQRMVWDALLTIPYGEIRTYSEIAHQIGRHKAWRAVGMANNKNPLPILVPCHRVIGTGGKLVGYGGGMQRKEFLLRLEGSL